MACPLCVWWPAARASDPLLPFCPVGEDSTTLSSTVSSQQGSRSIHSSLGQGLPGAGWNWGRARLSQVASPSPGSGTSLLDPEYPKDSPTARLVASSRCSIF